MTDEQARADASAELSQNQVSPGQMLREGRERHKLTQEQVAERLHLRHQVVSDLEQDHYSKYVSSTFTRGYLRAYARLVEVDEETVLAAYNALGFDDKPQQMKSFSRRTRQQSNDNKLMLVTYIVGALIIGSAVVFWLQNSQTSNDDVATQTDADTVAERLVDEQNDQVTIEQPANAQGRVNQVSQPIFIDTTDTNNALNSGNTSDAGNTSDLHESTSGANADTSGANADTSGTSDAARTIASDADSAAASSGTGSDPQSSAASVNANDASVSDAANPFDADSDATNSTPDQAPDTLPNAPLVLVFSGDAWIRIADASGEPVAFGVKPAGHVTALDGQPPYDIAIGAPENVALYYQGVAIDLSSYRPGRLARITIPQPE